MNAIKRTANGYTLIELLVVLGILALIAGFAIPVAARTVEGAMLQSDTRSVMVEIRRLENDAVAHQTTISLSAADDGGLEVSTGDALSIPSGSKVRLARGTEHILFFPDGTSSGGVLDVMRADDSARIQIAWLSGEVEDVREP